LLLSHLHQQQQQQHQQQQQQQFWSGLEASLRVQGCLLQPQPQQQQQQQQQKLALREQASDSLVCLAKQLPWMTQQQQPTTMLLSLLLSFCKLACVYAPGNPRVALALSSSVLYSCREALLATSISDGSSSNSSAVLPVSVAGAWAALPRIRPGASNV
jgi:hypothetical protein